MDRRLAMTLGWLRVGVGAGFIAAPKPTLQLGGVEPTEDMAILMRTIGVRDLVIGTGTVWAGLTGNDRDLRRWTTVALASDSIDIVVAGMAKTLPARGRAIAAFSPIPFVATGALALIRPRT